MVITNASILKKMMKEIQEALEDGRSSTVRERVRAIRLLCDLVLEEDEDENAITSHENVTKRKESPSEVNEPTAEEIRQMMGEDHVNKRQKTEKSSNRMEDDDANGESIFDF
ncbi:YwdI family protein [Thalassobacillus pellis]|uniref:YwdI family protein n=1 Tax=Thalassobacillus pellis TaxID=748008 RepID=UPI00195FCF06|nr:YwdI family protein [Thalassobacillus pellis]MBM7551826.1 acyl-CoA reductase-like NAD-dependent aldehyde dehydrogenase [Thalassobacillus pellis]